MQENPLPRWRFNTKPCMQVQSSYTIILQYFKTQVFSDWETMMQSIRRARKVNSRKHLISNISLFSRQAYITTIIVQFWIAAILVFRLLTSLTVLFRTQKYLLFSRHSVVIVTSEIRISTCNANFYRVIK